MQTSPASQPGRAVAALRPLAALPEPSTEELAQSVMRWFSEWVSGGLFAAIVLDEG